MSAREIIEISQMAEEIISDTNEETIIKSKSSESSSTIKPKNKRRVVIVDSDDSENDVDDFDSFLASNDKKVGVVKNNRLCASLSSSVYQDSASGGIDSTSSVGITSDSSVTSEGETGAKTKRGRGRPKLDRSKKPDEVAELLKIVQNGASNKKTLSPIKTRSKRAIEQLNKK